MIKSCQIYYIPKEMEDIQQSSKLSSEYRFVSSGLLSSHTPARGFMQFIQICLSIAKFQDNMSLDTHCCLVTNYTVICSRLFVPELWKIHIVLPSFPSKDRRKHVFEI